MRSQEIYNVLKDAKEALERDLSLLQEKMERVRNVTPDPRNKDFDLAMAKSLKRIWEEARSNLMAFLSEIDSGVTHY